MRAWLVAHSNFRHVQNAGCMNTIIQWTQQYYQVTERRYSYFHYFMISPNFWIKNICQFNGFIALNFEKQTIFNKFWKNSCFCVVYMYNVYFQATEYSTMCIVFLQQKFHKFINCRHRSSYLVTCLLVNGLQTFRF